MPEKLINGVPASQYGMRCRHGKQVMVADPADTSDHPATMFAEPWPCDVCTPEWLSAQMEAADEAYEADRWSEYYDTIREGLYGQPSRDYRDAS